MAVPTPIDQADIEFDNGTFDSTTFAAQALSNWQALAAVIDHTLFTPDATRAQVENLCDEAIRYHFASVLVQPAWTSLAVAALSGTRIPVGAVIGFPAGASLVSTLRQEAAALVRLGARELEMVAPIGQLKSGNHHAVQHAIRTVAHVAHHHGVLLKVILETGMLNMEQKLRSAEIAIQAGADFIKTSAGLGGSDATAADVALMRGVAGARCGVSASGAICTLDDVRAMLDAGANRIGASASVAIVQELGAE